MVRLAVPVRRWKSAVLAASAMPRQVALPVPVGLASVVSARGPGVGGLEGSAPGPPGIGNLPRLLAKHYCRVAVLSPEAVACEGGVVSQGAGDRIEIVPCACIFRAVELPEIAGGPDQLPRAGLGDRRLARAGEIVVEVLVRHQGCAKRKGFLLGRHKRGGAATTTAGGVSARAPASTVTGRLQGGMVVLLLPHRQRWPTKGGLADWMLIVMVVVVSSEPEVYVKLKGMLRRCVTALSTLTRQLHRHVQPRDRCCVSRTQPEATAVRSRHAHLGKGSQHTSLGQGKAVTHLGIHCAAVLCRCSGQDR